MNFQTLNESMHMYALMLKLFLHELTHEPGGSDHFCSWEYNCLQYLHVLSGGG